MLAEGQRQLADDRIFQVNAALAPEMDQTGREEFLRQLKNAATDPDDLFGESDDYSGIDQLKGVLGSA